MNDIPKNNFNNIPKPVMVTEEEYAERGAFLRSGNQDAQDIMDAIDNYIKNRNLKKDKFDKNDPESK